MKIIFSKFLSLFTRREKLQILVLFILILIGALIETFVVGLIYPFISMLNSPETIYNHGMLRWFCNFMGLKSTKEFLFWASTGLIVIYLFKNAYVICLAYAQSRFIFNKQISFSHRLFAFYLNQPHTFHLQRNTAELLQKINVVVPTLFSSFLLYALMFVIETITTMFILGLLIGVKPLPSIIAVGTLGIFTGTFYKLIRKKVSKLGKLRQDCSEKMIQWVNQGLGGLKETKILGREEFFVNAYNKNSMGYAHAERFMYIINQLPRPFLETICIMSMLLIIVFILAQNKDFGTIIPTLSLFAMAAFRIIPSMNRIFAAATVMRYNSYSVEVVYNDLVSFGKFITPPQKISANIITQIYRCSLSFFCSIFKKRSASIVSQRIEVKPQTFTNFSLEKSTDFDKEIELKDVYYQYPNTERFALNGISLIIPKHCSIGFVGPSGAGKTTVVDVILGLLTPTYGDVLVDGKSIKDNISAWQRRIGYIPQSIYLSDDTIRSNIAFGLPKEEINDEQVWSVLKSAQLKDFVNNLSGKLDAFVGERGIRLSGGQRQRIGIARALYNNPEILVMDEGTASLDNETEWEIMQTIKQLSGKKTIIIIAHRLSTVKNSDLLHFIKDGTVTNCGTYNELLEKSKDFRMMTMPTESK